MTQLYDCWDDTLQITQTMTLKGDGRAARASGYYVKELEMCLDAGLRCRFSPKIILITHGHTDHCSEIPLILTGIDTSVPILIPKGTLKDFEIYVNTLMKLSGSKSSIKRNFIEVEGGSVFNYKYGNTKYKIKVYDMDHSVSCVGYGIVEEKKKLDEQYVGQDIGALARSGVQVNKIVESPILLYLGDTHISFFDKYTDIFDYKVMITECSFLMSDEIDMANDKMHVHWEKLEPYIRDHPNVKFILTHFSMRYKIDEIIEFFSSKVYSNMIPYKCQNKGEVERQTWKEWAFSWMHV
jgi:ribonuclease Z